ncbi:hypothetical protein [Neobacillus terrae]|uniref:hypothetical protein n=1 Tax=Neobacillus terrae TaxID=3034837 RepID=UPI00140BC7E9|nr:hypothetical protein [Neobacillus terrae]NHM33444.1 hypothetical protein [Neobacillus terrae]
MKIDQQVLEQIILEVIARLNDKPKLLIVYEGVKRPEKIEYIISTLQDSWQVKTCSDTDSCLYEQTDYQHLAFLDVNQDLLVRGAMGLTDTPGSRLLAKALRQGDNVLFEPSKEIQWLLKQDNHSIPERVDRYRGHLLQYKNKLVEFGVWFGFIETLRPSQILYDRKLLTENDILNIESSELRVSSKTVITQLAKDTARERGIQIRVDPEGQS